MDPMRRPEQSGRLTIGAVAERTGLEPSAIRYYERIGLLPEPEREAGWRRYEDSAVRLLNAIRFAKRAGFSLDEIRTLFYGFPAGTPPPERWRELAERKLEEIDGLLAQARLMQDLLRDGFDCDCASRACRGLEDCEFTVAGEERHRGEPAGAGP
jgi:MerR family transcriptional regulator, redox-sensitive transcriptional activator SoxR